MLKISSCCRISLHLISDCRHTLCEMDFPANRSVFGAEWVAFKGKGTTQRQICLFLLFSQLLTSLTVQNWFATATLVTLGLLCQVLIRKASAKHTLIKCLTTLHSRLTDLVPLQWLKSYIFAKLNLWNWWNSQKLRHVSRDIHTLQAYLPFW